MRREFLTPNVLTPKKLCEENYLRERIYFDADTWIGREINI